MPYKPGDILLDKYRIEELIGKGAFAQVYRATHLALNVTRAVKVLRRDTPGVGSTAYRDFSERFRLEAQLGARLNTPISHTNLLHIYDFQQVDDLLVLEMEYASGGSLAERIQKAKESNQSNPIDEAVRMGLDVAQGLAAIHKLDAVHRDLKPSNILFDSRGTAKVADLGLAQIPGGPSMRSKLSQAAPHPGTPGYMSPEQTNISTYLTPASDVYALGLVLFETLTGRMYRNVRPGTLARELRENTPNWLNGLLARMLVKNPEDRPWDGAEVSKLLREVQVAGTHKKHDDQHRAEEQERFAEEQAKREAEQRATEIAQLLKEAEIAIVASRWARAEQVLTQLETLGEAGQAESKRLQVMLAEARQQAESRYREAEKTQQAGKHAHQPAQEEKINWRIVLLMFICIAILIFIFSTYN